MGALFGTILAGVFIFVIGQAIVKIFVEPIAEQRRVIGRIAHALIFDADVYSSPGGDLRVGLRERVAENLRNYSAELETATALIPLYSLLQVCHLVRAREEISMAAKNLIGIANTQTPDHEKEIHDRRNFIERTLGLPLTP